MTVAPQADPGAGAVVARLFDEHARMVLAICRLHLRDVLDAEDAAQQTFLSAHRALLAGTSPRDAAAWLATIARNECRRRIGRRLRTPQLMPLDDEGLASPSADTVQLAEDRSDLSRWCEAVSELPERQREAIVLRDLYGLSYEEVGAAMTVTTPAVTSLLSRARRGVARGVPRIAQGAIVVPVSLRDSLARIVPELGQSEASVAVAAGGGGLLAQLTSLPLTAKLATATMAATFTVGGAAQHVDRRVSEPVPRAEAATVPSVPERVRAGRTAANNTVVAPRAVRVLPRVAAPAPVLVAARGGNSGPGRSAEDGDDDAGPSVRSGPSEEDESRVEGSGTGSGAPAASDTESEPSGSEPSERESSGRGSDGSSGSSGGDSDSHESSGSSDGESSDGGSSGSGSGSGSGSDDDSSSASSDDVEDDAKDEPDD